MKFMPRIALFAGLLFAANAFAVEPSEMLPDPAQEARARELSAQLRCLVCQNESIDESHAELARDLRVLLREKITKGDSNDNIKAFLVARYGEFILLQPPFKPSTLLLWLSAPLILLVGGLVVYRGSRQTRPDISILSDEEERNLSRIVAEVEANTAMSKNGTQSLKT